MENFQKLPFGTPVQACATPTPHTSATQGDSTGPTGYLGSNGNHIVPLAPCGACAVALGR